MVTADDPAEETQDLRPGALRTQQPPLVIGIDGGEYRERDQEAVVLAKDDAPLHVAPMAKVLDHLEGDVARCEGGRGPQPDIRGRDEQWANQDDRHEAPADEGADPTPKPVSQERRDHGAAIRDEDRQEEPTHVLHRSRSRTIDNCQRSDHRDRFGAG